MAAGAEVTIVEMLPIVGTGIELITRRHLLADLRGKGVSILTKAKVTMVEPNAVLYEHTEDGSRARSTSRTSQRPSAGARADRRSPLSLDGPEVVVLGDAEHPGDFVSAINAGSGRGPAV